MNNKTLVASALALVLLSGCVSESAYQAETDRANAAKQEAAYATAYARSADQRASDANKRADIAIIQAGASSVANSSGLVLGLVVVLAVAGMYLTFAFVTTQNQNRQMHREEMARLELERMRLIGAAPPPAYTPRHRRVIIAQDLPLLPGGGR